MTDFATLCVLSYNRPDFLRTTIETAIRGAEGNPLELIIHDDGSTDVNVHFVLAEYADRATIITNPPGHNQGQGVALNRMFAMARGSLIVKVDQDLVFQPGWLTCAREIFDTNDALVTLGSEPRLGMLGLCHYFHEPVDMRQTVISHHGAWEHHPLLLGSAFAMTSESWSVFGPFEEHSDAFNEDGDMQRRITASDTHVVGISKHELAANPNMGPGPSTIVAIDGTGEIVVSKIHHGPKLIVST